MVLLTSWITRNKESNEAENPERDRKKKIEKILVNAFTHDIYFDGTQKSNEQIPY